VEGCETVTKKRRKPKGWVGEPGRHALARRGIESVQLEMPPRQIFSKSVIDEMVAIRELRAKLQTPNVPFDDMRLLREQIAMRERSVMRMVRRQQLEFLRLKRRKK
jgi:hypothetical protein